MVSILSQSLIIMYFICGFVSFALIAQSMPVPSAREHGAAILTVRSPGPRFIPASNNPVSGILSAAGVHINVSSLTNAIQNEIDDQLNKQEVPGVNADIKYGPVLATPTANNTPSSVTPVSVDTKKLTQGIADALTSALTSELNDSDEYGLSS